EVADVLELAKTSNADDLTRVFSGFSRGFDEIVRSGQVRASLEMTLVRLARRPPLLPLDELLARLGELERRLATGAPPPRGGGGGGGGTRTATPSPASITQNDVPTLGDRLLGRGAARGPVALAEQSVATSSPSRVAL